MNNLHKNILLLTSIYFLSFLNIQSALIGYTPPNHGMLGYVLDLSTNFTTSLRQNNSTQPICLVLSNQEKLNRFTQLLSQTALRHNANSPHQMNIVELDCQDLLNPDISDNEAIEFLNNTFMNSINSQSILFIKNLKYIYNQLPVPVTTGNNNSLNELSRSSLLMNRLFQLSCPMIFGNRFKGLLIIHLEERPDTNQSNLLGSYFKIISD